MPKRYAARKAARSKKSAPSRRWTWKTAAIFSVLVLVFGGAMLAQINRTASSGYEIRSLERQISDLKEEQEGLEFQVATERSVTSVEHKVAELGLVPASRVEYMAAGAAAVAKK